MAKERVAIVGAGAAGLATAYLLRDRCEVLLFEGGDHVGGHVATFVIPSGPDRGLPLDLGFMVMNRRRYPLFYRLLEDLGIAEVGESEMSFGYWEEATGFQYALNLDRRGELARRFNRGVPAPPARELTDMLPAIVRLQRAAAGFLEAPAEGDPAVRDFLEAHRLHGDVVDRYLVPMAAAIWSMDPAHVLDFPARPLLTFLDNHALLSPDEGVRWEHVHGGARRYVEALLETLPPGTVRREAVRAARRCGQGVELVTAGGARLLADRVVLACHADEARALMADATPAELDALAAWRYQRNVAVLHTDEAVMPPRRSAWASWNFVREAGAGPRLAVNYHLNRLQGHVDAQAQYFLSLNRRGHVDESKVLARVAFTHPVYGVESFRAQERLRALSASGRVLFCGSHLGLGFHEDAVRSAHDVARLLCVEPGGQAA